MKPTKAPLNGVGPGSGPGVKRELEQRQLREMRDRERAAIAHLREMLDRDMQVPTWMPVLQP